MGDGNTGVATVPRAPEALHTSIGESSQEYGDTLGVRLLVSDVARLSNTTLSSWGHPTPAADPDLFRWNSRRSPTWNTTRPCGQTRSKKASAHRIGAHADVPWS
jgi:hypothetical protein